MPAALNLGQGVRVLERSSTLTPISVRDVRAGLCEQINSALSPPHFDELSRTTAAFRPSPASFARFIGDFRNASLNAS